MHTMNYATIDFHLNQAGINVPETYTHIGDAGEEIKILDFKPQLLNHIKKQGKGFLISITPNEEVCLIANIKIKSIQLIIKKEKNYFFVLLAGRLTMNYSTALRTLSILLLSTFLKRLSKSFSILINLLIIVFSCLWVLIISSIIPTAACIPC